MMNKMLVIIPLFIASLSASFASNAEQTPLSVSFGITLQPARWQGENKSGGSDFDANASQLQLNARIKKDKFYGGLSFQGAEFNFSGGAPDIITAAGSQVTNNATIKRGEFDLVAGYYFWPRVSLFVDLKSITNEWQDINYSAKYAGLGVGATGYIPLDADWLLFGSVGVARLNIKTGGSDIGDGQGSALVIGFLYKLTTQSNFTISLKTQHNEYQFDQGPDQVHDIGGLVIGFNHTI